MASDAYLFDTNAIIESVRVKAWNALTGGLPIETVDEVRDECLRGDQFTAGYVTVSASDLARLRTVHTVPRSGRAQVELMKKSDALHAGEKDLFWYALNHLPDYRWVCSPDGGSVRFAVEHGLGDRLVSLEVAIRNVGHSTGKLRGHFKEHWLKHKRTIALLDLP